MHACRSLHRCFFSAEAFVWEGDEYRVFPGQVEQRTQPASKCSSQRLVQEALACPFITAASTGDMLCLENLRFSLRLCHIKTGESSCLHCHWSGIGAHGCIQSLPLRSLRGRLSKFCRVHLFARVLLSPISCALILAIPKVSDKLRWSPRDICSAVILSYFSIFIVSFVPFLLFDLGSISLSPRRVV